MTKFSETLDLLRSAIAWDKFTLGRFGVVFERTEDTELKSLIGSPKGDEVGEEPSSGFNDRASPWSETPDCRI